MASIVKLGLDEGECVTCEVGAMIAMTEGLSVETTSAMKGKAGGLLSGVKRMFAGENYFLNHFTAQQDGQILILGPTMQGDVIHHRLRGGTLLIQGSSWLASTPGVTIDASWQGLGKAFFSGEGAFWIRAQGQGDIFLSSFGAIYEVEVNGQYTVDTGHIVAFEDTMQFQIVKAGRQSDWQSAGWRRSCLPLHRPGKLYCQSHNPTSFGQMLSPSLKPR
ncbi:MAG UNVERIFIED_CONTAM: TIGR00266 family protein [Planctomycetaceae bacterium]|jgi:uncharacterized protein (TIGR00266 family)